MVGRKKAKDKVGANVQVNHPGPAQGVNIAIEGPATRGRKRKASALAAAPNGKVKLQV